MARPPRFGDCCSRTQQQAPQNPRLEDPRRSPQRPPTLGPRSQCCYDRLSPGSTRDIAMNTVRHAYAVAQDEVHDPAANLRLLAKSVDHLSR